MTRVLHVLWNGDIGGAERAVYQLALQQRRFSSVLPAIGFAQASGHFADRARECGIPMVDFALRSGRDVTALRRAVRILDAYDLHHFHAPELVLMLASMQTSATRLYTHRAGRMVYRGRRALRYRILGQVLRRFDAITGSQQATSAIHDLYRIPRERIYTTFNGVDPAVVAPNVSPSDVRARFGFSEAALLVGTAGRLRALKRVDVLIEAAGRLRPGDWNVVVIGDGPDRDRLEDLARRSFARPRIHFVGMQPQIGDWLSALDVFVLPTGPEESFGNAAVEAMAAGLPTIVFRDSPALTDHVIDRETGFIVGTTPELAERLQELIDDRLLRERVGTAAAALATSRYSMERVVDRFDAIYAAAVEARGGTFQSPGGGTEPNRRF
jgi:glycosyltransferase involved in cell wall biosynthesis